MTYDAKVELFNKHSGGANEKAARNNPSGPLDGTRTRVTLNLAYLEPPSERVG